MTEAWQRDARQLAERLIERGSVYDVDTLELIYDVDQYLLFVESDGSVRRMDRAENLEQFKAWRDAGATPLSTEADFLHVEEQKDSAVVLLRRRMGLDQPSQMFELRLRRTSQGWKVSGETVTPWPGDERGAI